MAWLLRVCALRGCVAKRAITSIMSTEENIPIEETAEVREYLEGKKTDYQDKIAKKEEYWESHNFSLESLSRSLATTS